jgi:imidazoleglycerol-phosphate dehydratase
VRDRNSDPGCEGCVRLTVGSLEHTRTADWRSARGGGKLRDHREVKSVRKAKLHRKTAETEIRIALTIEGRGKYEVSTGIRFLDHMLELFTRHGGFDLKLAATGDLDVDQHHTVEDVGIALGEVFDRALGDRRGILRAGYFVMPMDETLGLAAVDFGGRAAAVVDTKVRATLGGRSSGGTGARFLRGLCARRAR